MEQKNFGYSMKNIPIAGERAYLKCFMHKIERVIRPMRRKAWFFDNPGVEGTGANTFGFKSIKNPQPVEGLVAFEKGVYELI